MNIEEALLIINVVFSLRPTDTYEEVKKFFDRQDQAKQVVLDYVKKNNFLNEEKSSQNEEISSSKKEKEISVCKNTERHDHRKCPYFHPRKECRWGAKCNNNNCTFKHTICRDFNSDDGCSYGDQCRFIHLEE